ncbi:hypothetical protein C0Q70_15837 [Pomacea canaliculata]|uniref:Uncharacterized protein n=1 Tax=Pomacea canaliculata TaxID=400727 RepID=A0A2T7NVZ4_POMCA|nr:hypothetical protein C0Q70_15837 [Pomacea canaliculata]
MPWCSRCRADDRILAIDGDGDGDGESLRRGCERALRSRLSFVTATASDSDDNGAFSGARQEATAPVSRSEPSPETAIRPTQCACAG